MLSTKKLVNNSKSVPSAWIFEYYAQLQDKLTGQDIRINSLFNDKDDTPSMCIYYDKVKVEYRFKDFSTGKGGSAIDFVKAIRGLNYVQAVTTITEDYNEYILHNKVGLSPEEFKAQSKYRVTSHQLRTWNTRDQYQWTQFFIGSSILTIYYVKPLESYTMTKMENGELKELVISGDYIYGFFTKAGELYKIYQPKVSGKKYIKVKNYIQGSEQLEGHQYLAITSGLKDIMSLRGLNLKLDYIAPDSENTMIPKEQIVKYKKQYKKVFVFFDNDEAGIKAMKKYRDEYGLSCILLTMAKDPAESIKAYGPKKVTERLVPLFNCQLYDL